MPARPPARATLMSAWALWHLLRQQLPTEWRHWITILPSDRPWQMPFAAALASGLPLLVGAAFGRVDDGLVSSLGGRGLGCRLGLQGAGYCASGHAQHGGQAELPAVPAGKVFIFHRFWAPLAFSKRAAPSLYVMHRSNHCGQP